MVLATGGGIGSWKIWLGVSGVSMGACVWGVGGFRIACEGVCTRVRVTASCCQEELDPDTMRPMQLR